MSVLNFAEQEALVIFSEEAAESIQVASKIWRFGTDSIHLERLATERLAEEIADLEVMIKMLQNLNLVSRTQIDIYKKKKIARALDDVVSGERARFKHLPLEAIRRL